MDRLGLAEDLEVLLGSADLHQPAKVAIASVLGIARALDADTVHVILTLSEGETVRMATMAGPGPAREVVDRTVSAVPVHTAEGSP